MNTLNKKETVLITGATGYIGSHLAERLIRMGFNVHIITRRSSNLQLLEPIRKNIQIHRFDGTTSGMCSIVRSSRPDCVFHLASLFVVNHTLQEIAPLVESNILFGTQLLEAAGENGVKKFVNASTSWLHYQDSSYNPVCLYAATKKAFEDILTYYCEARSIKAISLEIFDTYGPNDPRKKLFFFLENARKNNEHLKMSPGYQLIDLVYIDDVIDAFIQARELFSVAQIKGHQEYMISTGHPIHLRKIVDTYEKVIHRKLDIEWGGLAYRDREVMIPWRKGKILSGWSAKINLQEGITIMLRSSPPVKNG